MENRRVLAKLVALVAPRLGADAHDAAQEALTRALEGNSALKGEALFAKASEQLVRILKQSYWELRKESALITGAKAARGRLKPVRREQSAKRRVPKGVVSELAFDSGFSLLPMDEGELADERLQFAATQLLAIDLPRLLSGEPYLPAFGEHVVSAYREIYGVEPQFHWAYLLVEEVEQAKLQFLQTSHPDVTSVGPIKSDVVLRRKRKSPGEPENLVSEAVAVTMQTVPGRAVRHLFTMIDGKPVRRGSTLLTQEPAFSYSDDAVERSRMILNVVRLRLAMLPIPQSLPAYADNPLLVRWLFARLGFGGGGGQESVKRQTLLEWLTDPVELVAQVRRYSRRRSRSGTAAQGKAIGDELVKLAREIKAQSSGGRP